MVARFVHEDAEEVQEVHSGFLDRTAEKEIPEEFADRREIYEGALRHLAVPAGSEINLKGELRDHENDGRRPGFVKLEDEVPLDAKPGLYRCDTVKVDFSYEEATNWCRREASNNFEEVNERGLQEWFVEEGALNAFEEVPNLRLRIADPYELGFVGWKWGDRSWWDKARSRWRELFRKVSIALGLRRA